MYTGIERCFQLLGSDARTKCQYIVVEQPLAPDRKYIICLANTVVSGGMY